jgi:outer membrane protein assembly factor BamE (lipoprotein component of BamABCDE complex)
MKVPAFTLSLLMICVTACSKSPTATERSQKSSQHSAASPQDRGRGVLTREEVAAILGSPVTSAEGAATDMEYKTATLSLETTVGIEVQND